MGSNEAHLAARKNVAVHVSTWSMLQAEVCLLQLFPFPANRPVQRGNPGLDVHLMDKER